MPAALHTATPADKAPQPAHSARVVQPFDVLDECHRQMVETLHKMSYMVERLQDQGLDAHVQQLAREVFTFFMGPARQHHLDEEKHVFPALIHSGDAALMDHTLRLQQDHGWIEQDWQELAPQFEAIAGGYNWFNTEQLALAVPVFIGLYQDHMALEESLIYPQARERISAWDLHGMGREMAQRRRQRHFQRD
jgi:hemerythrin-like domain-containing protein